jgi:RNA polymerase sigma-70 factor (ECF subfamily)
MAEMGALTTALEARPIGGERGIAADAFDQLVREHQRRVYRVLFLLVRESDAADTLTQECFLRAYVKRGSFRGESRIETWLLQIAVNLARDYLRNRRASFWRRLVGLDDADGSGVAIEFPDPHPTPERALLARKELEAVWEAAEGLSPQQRTVFLLRFGEDMELAEIAKVVGLRLGSVKTHLFRAIHAVRDKLKEQKWR